MFRIFLAEYGMLSRYSPIYAQTVVKYADTTVRLGMIKFIAFILEYRRFAQYRKTVCKAFRDEKLPVVVLGKFHSHMFPVSRRAFSYINRNIKHFAFYASYKFGLCKWRTLEM